MTRKEKLLEKFLKNPDSLRFKDIENLLYFFGFEFVSIRGSHYKFCHNSLNNHVVVPLHGKDCKKVYKYLLANILKRIIYDKKD